MMEKYTRKVQTSVTNFIHCGDDYLLLKRGTHKKIDPGKVNGIGGRVEPGEDYLSAAIRETKEETGIKVDASQIKFCGVVRLEGFYDEDWVMCFFKISVSSIKLPIGSKTEDGELIWINKDEVLNGELDLVDDIQYCFEEIVNENELFFISAQVGNDFKITNLTKQTLKK
ncbi:hypothetical protein A2631_02690 [Candidatus Daviesbacteria bacterium RIFCSPHIGHO2_01_FULL_44_29]|uniref:Nudix hydrolase domain-containing protein n=1 Tax=Candidatus Daviesbacteria bacterium RIFCSPHIGHO2_02_FULL_43_12 TaxID=1797776 RepID=A0A1F5KK69_9BACT|nr:MAG: hypothetical protein A2631_02690 [Candidatus Daviesbacteria bacterium RIFCSPHIGHO2_01_FULL_44_29]OGE40852.1 MAG: hypothetical protein A3E86_02660 [Candidatus Daviesbacteria bacterium RIFCSPHIGHO2_12_FULL_47_45]OGE41292.1 MAG: hypothetical protein A3D25_02085 [Candidatus Daviesbacteria bacterium RIFCSPHIGHO2_02_FULL_43_12]OGE69493.1 MAG: hypothetical protein A3B55_03825 [Candidatus Daviesbacteria bacterium RIFCSPLOWO2_01_FULL_43_15]